MEKDMKKAIVNKQKTHEAQMDPPPVLQNKLCSKINFGVLGSSKRLPQSPFLFYFGFFFSKIKWAWVPEVPSLGSLIWG